MYIKRFQIIDKDTKGYVSINDIRRGLKVRPRSRSQFFPFQSFLTAMISDKG